MRLLPSSLEAEGQGMHLHLVLAVSQCGGKQRIDVLDAGIGHRVATDRNAGAMHHQIGTVASVGAIKRVRVAEVETQVITAVWIQLSGPDLVNALWRLAIAFTLLRTEISRVRADWPGVEQRIDTGAGLRPDLEFAFLFENTHEYRCAPIGTDGVQA